MSCVGNRLQQLAEALNSTAKLKTLKLAFFHQDQHRFYRGQETPCDSLLTQAAFIQTEKLSWISRNMASREAMSPAKWQALRTKVHNLYPSDEEQFQEISMGYWNPIFQSLSN
ncbi:Hypothetical predicted protein [Lecanosticta acicola]|uniref:Uncharacterized protein n=1 Tax=Lecanosticta acicola TaxID=111012 RepID=A0AAI8YWN6_9PEZI|nr:Hypothetical predicted protein [Lecanosticta acicola]